MKCSIKISYILCIGRGFFHYEWPGQYTHVDIDQGIHKVKNVNLNEMKKLKDIHGFSYT